MKNNSNLIIVTQKNQRLTFPITDHPLFITNFDYKLFGYFILIYQYIWSKENFRKSKTLTTLISKVKELLQAFNEDKDLFPNFKSISILSDVTYGEILSIIDKDANILTFVNSLLATVMPDDYRPLSTNTVLFAARDPIIIYFVDWMRFCAENGLNYRLQEIPCNNI